MSSFTKAEGAKIVIKFTENLIGDVTGKEDPPVGGYVETEIAQNSEIGGQTYDASSYTSYPSDNAFDGTTSTYWRTFSAPPQWIQVDLGEGNAYAANKFRWYVSSYRPNAFNLKGSNDLIAWSDALVDDNSPNSTGWHEWEFANTTEYRYYRWEITSKYSSYIYVYEIDLYADLAVGNEGAFTVTGQEPLYIQYPSEELGELVDSDIQIDRVEAYPSTPSQMILHTKPLNRFHNTEGLLTVTYDKNLGNLQGIGGIVDNFSVACTPLDIVRVPNPSVEPENINIALSSYTIACTPITDVLVGDGDYPTEDARFNDTTIYQWEAENVNVSLTDYVIDLIHIDDLNP